MRLTMLCALALTSCAPAVAPASSPASLPGCLDVQGQRELIAGVELEAGAQAGALARCTVQRSAAVTYGDAQTKRADSAEARVVWVPIVTSVLAAVAAALTTYGVEKATQHPAMVAP